MIIRSKQNETIFNDKGVIGKRLYSDAVCEYVKLQIDAQSSVADHSLDVPATFYIMEGTGDVKIDGKSASVQAGDLITVAPHVDRAWKNNSNDVLSILVIKYMTRA